MRSNLGTGPNGWLPQPIELRPAETQRVAGGSPTLPLPPPRRDYPIPDPW
jgi:hypothetical protein